MTAPSRIWIDAWGGNWSQLSGGTQNVEYIRADAPELLALVGLLAEARTDLAAYVDADWPEHQRSNYPPIQAKWKRDMALCWQIDAALARVKGGAA